MQEFERPRQIKQIIDIPSSSLMPLEPTAGDHFRENEWVRLRRLESLRENFKQYLPERLTQLAAGRMTQQEFDYWIRSHCFVLESKRHP